MVPPFFTGMWDLVDSADPKIGHGYSGGISMSMSKSPPEYLVAGEWKSEDTVKMVKRWETTNQINRHQSSSTKLYQVPSNFYLQVSRTAFLLGPWAKPSNVSDRFPPQVSALGSQQTEATRKGQENWPFKLQFECMFFGEGPENPFVKMERRWGNLQDFGLGKMEIGATIWLLLRGQTPYTLHHHFLIPVIPPPNHQAMITLFSVFYWNDLWMSIPKISLSDAPSDPAFREFWDVRSSLVHDKWLPMTSSNSANLRTKRTKTPRKTHNIILKHKIDVWAYIYLYINRFSQFIHWSAASAPHRVRGYLSFLPIFGKSPDVLRWHVDLLSLLGGRGWDMKNLCAEFNKLGWRMLGGWALVLKGGYKDS